jgi:hypothetical protein
METKALERRRMPRSPRVWDPLLETAAIALLVLLAFFLFVA